MKLDPSVQRRLVSVQRRTRRGRPKGRQGYGPEIRAEAVEVTALLREAGWPLRRCANELGVSLEGLRKWIRNANHSPAQPASAMKPVRVVKPKEPPRSSLVLRLPGGAELVGLTAKDAAEIVGSFA